MRTRVIRLPFVGAVRVQPVSNMVEAAQRKQDVLIGFIPAGGWRAYRINCRSQGRIHADEDVSLSGYERVCRAAHLTNEVEFGPDTVTLYHHTAEALTRCSELEAAVKVQVR